MNIKSALTYFAAGTALVAAVLWLRSAIVTVAPSDEIDNTGWQDAQIILDTNKGEIDFIQTAKAQSYWNMLAAIAASISAAAQGLAMIFPDT
jgi:hypothetical protein